jgi:hypothetical protein
MTKMKRVQNISEVSRRGSQERVEGREKGSQRGRWAVDLKRRIKSDSYTTKGSELKHHTRLQLALNDAGRPEAAPSQLRSRQTVCWLTAGL